MKMIGIIFSDVYGSELEELTRNRTVASMPFGGRYRQIDFALSNMVNSEIFNIGVVTNFLPATGISLPFFSYGGTALLIQLFEVGLILSISRQNDNKLL